MTISEYLQRINRRYQNDISTEHSYRGDLLSLLESLLPALSITNEPRRIDVGAPDYILMHDAIPVGFIEAKDIGDTDLDGKKAHKEQFNRYKATQDPYIFTDYLDFHLYLQGDFITSIRIADIEDGQIVPRPARFDEFRDLTTNFASQGGQTIRSASKLSKIMAAKARYLSDIIENALIRDEETGGVNESANNTLREQLAAFQNVLIHDIDAEEFADIYAQTIAYGMFAARLHDPSLDTFSRHEAAELIPKTNPFLRKLFQYIAGYDLDDRLTWIVDALADVFRATDVAALLEDFGQASGQHDPIIHFYETFLAEFDRALRKSRGVWYTPEPVVNFIVRAVDDILKDEFGLKDGLADTSKTTVNVKTDVRDDRSADGYKHEEREVHKVQILDPAAGTGTFLAEVINQIHQQFKGQEGIWPAYVEDHLIPRLNGFELLMASYAMAHLKLDMLLRETGYDREAGQRFRIYLTNSLEEHHPETSTLFATALSEEANQANRVKRDTPVMVVMGNPPYSVSSSNKGKWIEKLMQDYKKDLNERNIQPLSDDYIKFIRYGQHFIEKNGEGILAYISNNSFLDGIIHRKMRENLLKTFDQIFILDLHGDSKKKEKTKDGKSDKNVFDIMQGVSVNIFIKNKLSENNLANTFKTDLFGSRNFKYDRLKKLKISSIEWEQLAVEPPHYFLVRKDFTDKKQYNEFISIPDLFNEYNSGIQTEFDAFAISENKNNLKKRLKALKNEPVKSILDSLNLDTKYYKKIENAKSDALENNPQIINYNYRLFDQRKALYTGSSNGIMGRPRGRTMIHMLKDNLSLIVPKQTNIEFNHAFINSIPCDSNLIASSKKFGCGSIFPLYLYPEEGGQQTLDGQPERRPNLNMDIVDEIADKLGLHFVPEPEKDGVHLRGGPHLNADRPEKKKEDHAMRSGAKKAFAPIDLLDYIYAVLHSPSYRDKYKEFLKIDFPRVPYPSDAETFWRLVALGGELRQIHLLEHPVVDDFITTYPEAGSNKITKRLTKTQPGFMPYDDQVESTSKVASTSNATAPVDGGRSKSGLHQTARYPNEPLGKVQINKKQYFGQVPEKAWNFYIGGYQPAEKWLKDRRDRELSVEEIRHYQKIIVALMETDRIMQKIDGIDIE